ncbi:MAG: hypothetical protein P9M03_04530 [Candidatus Theseobacter exili]|nr:hypothetical protein [Candidatus Theseobacter exili]
MSDEKNILQDDDKQIPDDTATAPSEKTPKGMKERRHQQDFQKGYGRRKSDHPIKCLDCGCTRRMYWEEGVSCPLCESPRFFPMIIVEKKFLKEVRKGQIVIDFAKRIHRSIVYIKNWKHSKILGLIAIGIVLIAWLSCFLNTREITYSLDEAKFEWSKFYECGVCKYRFSLNECKDKDLPSCPKCKSLYAIRFYKSRRIAE